ncbi:ribonuclease H-like domain-containing protein [Gilliamella sp. W8128]|uniref:ribonuclease H-like domain-containing protein n=1 Tax=Gilliamella sp. W8128 TaxID=2751010 RepID=UPI0018DE6891|nr:ribonuclease H-like domain-containing protein [Gilliamella sp. W8128]MBI0154151.1 ribonuclease H-like domain-containing protein [Gilliamella sp. W8128]
MRQFNIYFDIETIPTQSDNIKNYIQSNLTAPANYKKPDSISAWIEENKEPAYRKTALNGGFGQIVCIGYAINDGDVKVIHFDNWASSEKQILQSFFNDLIECYRPSSDITPHFIGHNIENFDLRFIYQRAIVLGVKPPAFLPLNSKSYNNMYIFDTMTEWAGKRNYVSLNEICLSLGIQPKGDEIDGSKVWDFVRDGKLKQVADYCADDVEKVRAIYKRITFQDVA